MCDYDGDAPKFCVERVYKARKPYWCCECPTRIKAGDQYRLYAGKWDDFQSYRRCQKCAQISDAMNAIRCTWTFTSLREGARYALEDVEHEAANPKAFERLQELLSEETLNISSGSPSEAL